MAWAGGPWPRWIPSPSIFTRGSVSRVTEDPTGVLGSTKPINGRCLADGDAAGPHAPRHASGSSATRSDGCASPACSSNRSGRGTPTPERSRPSRPGCATSAGCPKRRFAAACVPSTASLIAWIAAEWPWPRSGSTTSIGRSHAGMPATAAGSRSRPGISTTACDGSSRSSWTTPRLARASQTQSTGHACDLETEPSKNI